MRTHPRTASWLVGTFLPVLVIGAPALVLLAALWGAAESWIGGLEQVLAVVAASTERIPAIEAPTGRLGIPACIAGASDADEDDGCDGDDVAQ